MKQTTKVLILLSICIFYYHLPTPFQPITQTRIVVLQCGYYNKGNSIELIYLPSILPCIKAFPQHPIAKARMTMSFLISLLNSNVTSLIAILLIFHSTSHVIYQEPSVAVALCLSVVTIKTQPISKLPLRFSLI